MSLLSDVSHIEIHGEEVRIVRVQVQKRVKTEEFIQKMSGLKPVNSGLQPGGCIYYQRWTQNNVPHALYVIEWEPRRVSLSYRNIDYHSVDTDVYEVGFPFTQWYFHCIGGSAMRVYVTCTSHRVKQMEDKIWWMPLPNHDSSGFCQGDVNANSKLPLSQQCEQLLTDLITSIWNDDLHPRWRDYGLQDSAEMDTAAAEIEEALRIWNEKFRALEAEMIAEEDPDRKKTKAKGLEEYRETWPDVERPLATKWVGAKGIPYWAKQYAEKGEDHWPLLLVRDHRQATFAGMVTHLARMGSV